MALTVELPSRSNDVFGGHYVRFLTVTFDSAQAADGEDLDLRPYSPNGTPSDPVFVGISVDNTAGDEGYVVSYDYANRKLIASEQSDSDNAVPLTEADGDLSALSVRLFVVY